MTFCKFSRAAGALAIALAAFSLGVGGASAQSQKHTAHAGPAFPMGVWYEGGVGALRQNLIPEDPAQAEKLYDRNFADIKAHGVNCVVVPNTPPSHHKALLDAAHKNGLKLIIETGVSGGLPGAMTRGGKPFDAEALRADLQTSLVPVMNEPALWRVQINDECPPQDFDNYNKVAQVLESVAPGIKPFTCLVRANNFDAFFTATHSDVAAFDDYPFGANMPESDLAALKQFEAQATHAGLSCAHANADAWAVIQAHSVTGSHGFPTPTEVRCMTNLALASGCRGVYWFLYQTEYLNKQKSSVMGGLVDSDYKSSDRWAEVGKLTKQINRIAPILLTLRPVDDSSAATSSQTVHLLQDTHGGKYLFAVNLDTKAPETVTVHYKVGDGAHMEHVTKMPGNKKVKFTRDGDTLTWSEKLGPGDGALYRCE